MTRCQRISGIDEVVCAIPGTPDNDCLRDEAEKYATVFRDFPDANENDVLRRYYRATVWRFADYIMRITADCPLISPELCGTILATAIEKGAQYASNLEPRTFPQGLDCEVFTRDLLWAADGQAEGSEREHVTLWMRRSERVRQFRVNVRSPWPIEGRLTLDTWDDYKTICAAFGHDADISLRAA